MKSFHKSFFFVWRDSETDSFKNPQIVWGFKNTYSFENKNLLDIMKLRPDKLQQQNTRRCYQVKDNNLSLSHTVWNCKYHVVFAPKYRRKVFYGSKRLEIGAILRKLCEFKGVTIIEAEVCPDHVHMLLEIPPKMSVSGFMGYLKGKSSLMIYQRWGNLKFKYRNREFWCRGFYVDTVGKNTKKIKEYISNQLKEDEEMTQLSIDFQGDPFKGN